MSRIYVLIVILQFLAISSAFRTLFHRNVLSSAPTILQPKVVDAFRSVLTRDSTEKFAAPATPTPTSPATGTPGDRRSRKNTKEDVILLDGKVLEALPNAMFKVQLQPPASQIIVCSVCGKIRKNMVRIIVGDNVEVEVSAYDLTKGRITFRHK